MSLYNHFRDKSALLDAIHEAVLLDAAPYPGARNAGWKTLARSFARTLL